MSADTLSVTQEALVVRIREVNTDTGDSSCSQGNFAGVEYSRLLLLE